MTFYYFDGNAVVGLMETHNNVDESLRIKLNYHIFILIVWQTYCDLDSLSDLL